jgi:hypothetical protein
VSGSPLVSHDSESCCLLAARDGEPRLPQWDGVVRVVLKPAPQVVELRLVGQPPQHAQRVRAVPLYLLSHCAFGKRARHNGVQQTPD